MEGKNLAEAIEKLKNEKDAIILVHNYQRPEIQNIADLLGDSLDLSKKAKETDKKIILFCGVQFMAETAKILSPDKKVLLPVKDAGCPMADMVTAEALIKFKQKHPDFKIVTYINTSAEVKSVSDVCCTSANATSVVQSVPFKKILFVPDKNLGNYVKARVKDKEIKLWNGFCSVHTTIFKKEIINIKKEHPDAILLVHPECNEEIVKIADYVMSTNQMVKFVRNSKEKEFIIGTESGLIYRLQKENPEKIFYSTSNTIPPICMNMKKTKLIDVYNALKNEQYEIKLSEDIIKRAQIALNKMLEYS